MQSRPEVLPPAPEGEDDVAVPEPDGGEVGDLCVDADDPANS
jgi:hypothetical protein